MRYSAIMGSGQKNGPWIVSTCRSARRARRVRAAPHESMESRMTELTLGTHETSAAVTAFVQNAQERGFVSTTELDALQTEHDLDEEALGALRAALEEADVEIEEASATDEPELD